MATKLFRIGEYAVYGKWRATVEGNTLKLEGVEWDSGVMQEARMFTNPERRELLNYLNENMSSYYADQIIDWISERMDIPQMSFTAFSL